MLFNVLIWSLLVVISVANVRVIFWFFKPPQDLYKLKGGYTCAAIFLGTPIMLAGAFWGVFLQGLPFNIGGLLAVITGGILCLYNSYFILSIELKQKADQIFKDWLFLDENEKKDSFLYYKSQFKKKETNPGPMIDFFYMILRVRVDGDFIKLKHLIHNIECYYSEDKKSVMIIDPEKT
jgi:hypothetical protein